MPDDPGKQWEFHPDQRKFVDVSRCRLPEGWLVHASGMGGATRFGGFVHYPDPGHEWKPLEEKGAVGTRRFLRWEKLEESPDGFGARLEVPGGWLVFIDLENEGSVAQLVFCPDLHHGWTHG